MSKQRFLLDILIPTYNRKSYLEKNIDLLAKYIMEINAQDKVRIIVSNNASIDGTKEMLDEKLNFLNQKIYIDVFHQNKNIGLERNAVFCLSKSTAEFCMFLGDDDYLDIRYFKKVIDILEKDKEVTCILPAFVNIDMEGNVLPNTGRDINKKNKIYKGGSLDAARLMIKGHQLSGVTFKREGTLEAYLENKNLRNIYLFIFFVGFNIRRGKCYHITEYPVKVTLPPQSKKDWNYGEDGLYEDRFRNSKALFKDCLLFRVLAEIFIINSDFVTVYFLKNGGIKKFLRYLMKFLKIKSATPFAKFYYLIFIQFHIPFRALKFALKIFK